MKWKFWAKKGVSVIFCSTLYFIFHLKQQYLWILSVFLWSQKITAPTVETRHKELKCYKTLLQIFKDNFACPSSLYSFGGFFTPDIILIIHVSSCISGSATCIEDIYNVANRTRRLCCRVRFAKHCECPKSCCTAANKCIISFIKWVECN